LWASDTTLLSSLHSFDVLQGCVEKRYASNVLVALQDLHVLHAASAEKAPLYPGISSFA
jgi:hypothetical protein